MPLSVPEFFEHLYRRKKEILARAVSFSAFFLAFSLVLGILYYIIMNFLPPDIQVIVAFLIVVFSLPLLAVEYVKQTSVYKKIGWKLYISFIFYIFLFSFSLWLISSPNLVLVLFGLSLFLIFLGLIFYPYIHARGYGILQSSRSSLRIFTSDWKLPIFLILLVFTSFFLSLGFYVNLPPYPQVSSLQDVILFPIILTSIYIISSLIILIPGFFADFVVENYGV